MNTNPMDRLSPTVANRAMLIDSALREHGSRVFFYSPKHIKTLAEEVPGYLIEGNEFVPARSSIPMVNGNWTYSTRRLLDKGMGYHQLIDWIGDNNVEIYVPLSFSDLVVRKYETYKLVRAFRAGLHPHTELYQQSLKQLEFFVEQNELVFLKPRAGNKGDGIATVRRANDGFNANFYQGGQRQTLSAKKLTDAFDFLNHITGNSRKYVIQEGVESMRHEGSVFDIRVIMLYNGEEWSWLHEARYSAAGSDLSNVSQGGISLEAGTLLFNLLGPEQSTQILDQLKTDAFGLARFLDDIHPGQLMEVAFDFVLDTEGQLRIVEINSKPGLVSAGFDDYHFNMRPDQRPLFERWVYPHTNSLARFLQSKVAAD